MSKVIEARLFDEIAKLKRKGYNSGRVADSLGVPLTKINRIYPSISTQR